jgi:hypothetical protein
MDVEDQIPPTLPLQKGGIPPLWYPFPVFNQAGFLIVGLSKEKAIATGFGVHIIIFIVCALISFFCWITLKKQKNPSPSAL